MKIKLRKINKSTSIFYFLLVTLFFNVRLFSQCQESVLYSRGKFRIIKYDSLWNKIVLPTEYSGFNKMTKESIDKNNDGLDEYDGRRIKDSSAICGQPVNIFSLGAKWAAVDGDGKQITDFKYDDLLIYRPLYLGGNGRYTKYGYWDKFLILVRIDNFFGLINKDGKEITVINYSIPYVDRIYGDVYDTILYSTKNVFRNKDTVDCGACGQPNYRSISFPTAGKSVILVKKNKLGSIDSSGKTVIPFIYDKIKIYRDVVETEINGKKIFYSENGNEVSGFNEIHPILLIYTPQGYTSGFSLFEGMYMVKQKGKWGCINSIKNEMVPCVFDYDDAYPIFFESTNNSYMVHFVKNKKDFYIETKNKTLVVSNEYGDDVTVKFIQKYDKKKK